MSSYEVVVSHYNEDLTWLQTQFSIDKLHVYCKGDPPNINCKYSQLPNVGREAHTFLHYIIERYDSLPSIVFFTQGRIDDHGLITSNINYLRMDNIYEKMINCIITHRHLTSPIYCGVGPVHDHVMPNDQHNQYMRPSPYTIKEWIRIYVNSTIDFDKVKYMFIASTMTIRKEHILSRSKQYYMDLIKQVSDCNLPEEGYYFEMAWYYIFNLDTLFSSYENSFIYTLYL